MQQSNTSTSNHATQHTHSQDTTATHPSRKLVNYKRLACYEHCPGTFGYTFVLIAWDVYWNHCPSFLKGLQGSEKKIVQEYHNCHRSLIVSDTWDNNKGKWKSSTFHIGLKIVMYLNICHFNQCRTYLEISSSNVACYFIILCHSIMISTPHPPAPPKNSLKVQFDIPGTHVSRCLLLLSVF